MIRPMYIDLTVNLDAKTPVYPGDPPVAITPAGRLERDGYADHTMTLVTHVGTHIDAPAHMITGGRTLDAYPLERFVGRGLYIDARPGFDLAAVKQAGIRPGDIVLFHTGWGDRYFDPAYFTDSPPVPEDVARYLVAQKVALVGMDMAGPDQPPHLIHQILLNGDVLIVENLTNLDQLAGHSFTVYALPLKLNLDGAPARVIASIAS
jgi:arylformamidase